jgi:predicted CoA-substrate-specific enzyme activase
MITCGIDIGSTTIEVVVMNDGATVASAMDLCGPAPAARAERLFTSTLERCGFSREAVATVATGFGRNYFAGAGEVFSEIRCHAAGVVSLFPGAHTVIEIGGQDSKLIHLDDRGRVVDFAMNDRCAAGTGRFVETVARALNIPVEETGDLALRAQVPKEISSMCAVFAETEIVGLLHQGASAESILRGVFNAVGRRVLGMAGRIGLPEEIVLTGGVAMNRGVHRALEEITGKKIRVPAEPGFTGALGAALLAQRNGVAERRVLNNHKAQDDHAER